MVISNLAMLSVLFIGIFSSIPSGMALSSCGEPDSTEPFTVAGLYSDPTKTMECSEIINAYQRKCSFPTVKAKCATKCCNGGFEKGKDTTFKFFIDEKKHLGANKKYSCVWAGRQHNNAKRCAKFPIVKELCSSTCAQKVFKTKYELDEVVGAYCESPSTWDAYKPFASYGRIEEWDMSLVTDFTNLFQAKTYCNPDISAWDVSHVTTFAGMFYAATNFNADISTWDVSSSTSFETMFFSAQTFNANIGDWDVSSSTSFAAMFAAATNFNADISTWDVSSSTSFNSMFYNAATNFNADIGDWDVSSSTSFNYMFYAATNFNADISTWDVSSSKAFSSMFKKAKKFNADIGAWDVSSSTSFNDMISGADSFDIEFLCPWHAKYDLVNKNNNMCDFECDWNVCSFNR